MHVARKRFGQHFLTDHGVIDAMVTAIAPVAGQMMIEIGPGLAALTRPLVERLGALTVIELDRDLAHRLRTDPRLSVIAADVLRVNITEIARASSVIKVRIVGNLPYNISTSVLFHLLDHVAVVADQHVMLQKEVVDRMVAQPSTAAYGRLSVMLQWRYDMACVLQVGPGSFSPPPRVHSAVVRMTPRHHPAPIDQPLLSEVVRVAFSQRRKLLRHTLGQWLDQHNFAGQFDAHRRAEEVPVDEYLRLVATLMEALVSTRDQGVQ